MHFLQQKKKKLDFQVLRLYPWMWQSRNAFQEVPDMPVLTAEERLEATEALAAYLTERRQKYADLISSNGLEQITAEDPNAAQKLKELEQIDTTLLTCHLQTKPKLVASLVRIKNFSCDLDVSKQLLIVSVGVGFWGHRAKFSCLFWLY